MGRVLQSQPSHIVPDKIRLALAVLLEGADYSEQTSGNSWEFSVELERLLLLGLNLNDFRWLVRNHLVVHQCEITLDGDNGRAFRPTGDLTFPDRTCFVLTDRGVSLARKCCLSTGRRTTYIFESGAADFIDRLFASIDALPIGNRPAIDIVRAITLLPKWDGDRRLLMLNEDVVKKFKWLAENQEAILSAFEEEGWPPRIDDPLSPHPEQDSKRRLSDTIKCLNRKQCRPLIRFRGDGTGEGVLWELVK